ncbi:SCAN domain-containing protein 3, partial [Stegodyphus mimosarum]
MSENDIPWNKCLDVGSDGAQALTGKHSGVIAQIKKVAPETKFTHCSTHRETSSLVAKMIHESPKIVLNQTVKIVNFFKSHALTL